MKKDEEGIRSRSCWEDMLPELLELILQKLTAMEHLKCSQICPSWRDIVDDALASEGRCPPKPQPPFILTFQVDKAPEFLSKYHITSVHGWLMFQGCFQLTYLEEEENYCAIMTLFFNPISGSWFKLPHLVFPGSWSLYDLLRIGFRFTPGSSNFVMAMSLSAKHGQKLAFCKPNQDSWTFTSTEETRCRLTNIAMYGNKLFATAKDKDNNEVDVFLTFTLDDLETIAVERSVMLEFKPYLPSDELVFVMSDETRLEINRVIQMLAVDPVNGELLLVYQVMDRACNGEKYSCRTNRFHVYRLDLSMSGPRWCEVTHLGDRFLFVDQSRATVVSARVIEYRLEFHGGNCVFFCYANTFHEKEDDRFHDIGVFFMESKTIQLYSFDCASPNSFRDIWLTPSLW